MNDTIIKKRYRWVYDKTNRKWCRKGLRKVWILSGSKPLNPSTHLHIYTRTSINKLIMHKVYIDKIEFHINLDYVQEGEDWEIERKLLRSYNPGGNPTFAIRKEKGLLYIRVMAEALNHEEDILSQVEDYLNQVYQCVGFIPNQKDGYGPKNKLLSTKFINNPKYFDNDREMFSLWMSHLKLNTLEICFPIGWGLPRKYFKVDKFFNYKGTLYTLKSERKNNRVPKDAGKIYEMSQVNIGIDKPFTKFEVVLHHTWCNMILQDLQGNAQDILKHFEVEVKEVLKQVELRNLREYWNTIFLNRYYTRGGTYYSKDSNAVKRREYLHKCISECVDKGNTSLLDIKRAWKGKRGKYKKEWSDSTLRAVLKEIVGQKPYKVL